MRARSPLTQLVCPPVHAAVVISGEKSTKATTVTQGKEKGHRVHRSERTFNKFSR